jgi:phospholipid/cholesterol/gamma-HCH transport system substrate-binding protein
MIKKEQKLRLGVFLVVSSVLLAAILAVLIIPKLSEEGDLYYINFKGMSVNGVNEGADVKYQGVRIGKVVRLEVNPRDLNSILIYVRIKSGFPVKADMAAALQYAGITGLRFVEISGGKPESEFVEPEGEILTKKGLGEKAEDIVLNVDNVVNAVNDLLKTENREKMAQLVENLEKSTRIISNVLEKREKNFANSLEELDQTMIQLTQLSENLNKFVSHLNNISADGRIENLVRDSEKLVKTISQRFSDEELGRVLGKLDNFLETAGSSVRKIENQFFDIESEFNETLVSLRESMENISHFTRELTEDPTILIRKRAKKRKKE